MCFRVGGAEWDVCVNRAPFHTERFEHRRLIQFLLVSVGLGRAMYPNQTSWVFMGRVQWLQLLL